MPQLEQETLDAGLEALHLPLESSQIQLLLAYLALIAKWNRVYNLTAVRDSSAMLSLHLLDSLAAVRPLQRHLDGRPGRVLDVGSGAGLPGVVFAITNPEVTVTCVDTVGKKASFIRQVAAELGLRNLLVEHARVEQLQVPPVDIVTSRAFASLVDFTAWTKQHLKPDAVWMAMKGKVPEDEISALPDPVTVFHVEQLHVPGLEAERCLVWLRNQAATEV
jgi:16S rRNA (guanine527-N7)-methyltransferase